VAKSDHKLTIAHFIPWSGGGGTEMATLRMADATKDDFNHVAFCLPDAGPVRDSFEKLGIATVTYTAPEPSLLHARRFYGESAVVARQLRTIGADIAHFAEIKAAYHNSLAARLARCRMICHVRNSYPDISLRVRTTLLPVNRFVFVSRGARQHFAISVPDQKASVIYDPIEIPPVAPASTNSEVRNELGIPIDSIVVGMVARVNPQKDYFTLASAAVEVLHQYPNTRFVVVGDNSNVELNRTHFKEVLQRLNELGIADSFVFTGHRDDVPRLIAAMDICVLITHREGFGLSIAESMAQRKPVVATAVGGLLEVIQHGETGYLCQHLNSKELADAIISLMDEPDKAEQLGLAAYEHVQRTFSRKAFVDYIKEMYETVAQNQTGT
jgi:glycosyltransferase involved in cell wall biosynthesis